MGNDIVLHKWPDSCAEGPNGALSAAPPNVSVIPIDEQSRECWVRPPGHTYRNERGMAFMVAQYVPFGFRHAPAGPGANTAIEIHGNRPPVSVVPVVRYLNPSERLNQLYREIDCVTPKAVVFADASGLPQRCRQIMEGLHFTSWRELRDVIPVIIDSGNTREEIVAHELMHIWLDLVEGYEDYRRYRDTADGRSSFAVLSTQSLVIDCKVQEKLRERGFALRPYADEIAEVLQENAMAVQTGASFRNRFQESVIAGLLAVPSAAPGLHEFTEEARRRIRYARAVFERHVPRLVRFADRLVAAFRANGYGARQQALELIDDCLVLQFEYLEQDFDLGRDLRIERDQIEWRNKYPSVMPNVPPEFKHDILRRLIRDKWPKGTQVITRWTDDGSRLDVSFIPPPADIARADEPLAETARRGGQ
jgi:hypothetical protein